MGLIVVWLIIMYCIITGNADNDFIHFVIGAFLFVLFAGVAFISTAISKSDEYKKEKAEDEEKKARLRREKRIQKEEAQRQKRQAKENQRERRKDEKKSQKRRRREKKLEKKSQKQVLKQARKDFFSIRRLIERQDKLQKKQQKKLDRRNRKLDRYNRKEVIGSQSVQIVQTHLKTKRDKSKSIKLTSFILPIVAFITMMGCIIGSVISSQIISAQIQNSHIQVITDYYHVGYNDSS